MSKGLNPKTMQDIALIVLVRDVFASPDGRICLTKEDFARVDTLDPHDQWTIDVDEKDDVWIGFVPKKADA